MRANPVRAELTASGTVYDRIWALKARSLSESAGVLARDYGFRMAVASGDTPTIHSAIANLRQRVGVPEAFVVDQDGEVIGNGPADLRKLVADLPYDLAPGRRTAVMAAKSGTYRLVVSPILAPTEIGWVVFAVPLDAAEMRALEKLSAIPFTATMLARDAAGHWVAANGTIPPDAELDRFVAADRARRVDSAETLGLPGGTAFVMAKMLKGADGKPSAALLLSYPLAQALAPYRALQIGIGLAGLLGLALVLWGSRRLAAHHRQADRRARRRCPRARRRRAHRGRGDRRRRDRPPRRQLQQDVGGYHRARAPHQPSRLPRHADRSAQPRLLPRTARRRPGARGEPQRRRGGRAVPRSRRVQGRQRHARPPDRRRAAADRRQRPRRLAPDGDSSRGSAATNSR